MPHTSLRVCHRSEGDNFVSAPNQYGLCDFLKKQELVSEVTVTVMAISVWLERSGRNFKKNGLNIYSLQNKQVFGPLIRQLGWRLVLSGGN